MKWLLGVALLAGMRRFECTPKLGIEPLAGCGCNFTLLAFSSHPRHYHKLRTKWHSPLNSLSIDTRPIQCSLQSSPNPPAPRKPSSYLHIVHFESLSTKRGSVPADLLQSRIYTQQLQVPHRAVRPFQKSSKINRIQALSFPYNR